MSPPESQSTPASIAAKWRHNSGEAAAILGQDEDTGLGRREGSCQRPKVRAWMASSVAFASGMYWMNPAMVAHDG